VERLSSPVADLRERYDVVVVGSGYGGAIAACRLARAGRTVCVLERGRELHPGEYPETLVEAARQTQAHVGGRRVGPATGLFDLHLGDDINVVVGCGLGGTSLINANVALEADPRVFEDARWPERLRGGHDELLRMGYDEARRMLGSTPYPDDAPALRKLDALGRAGNALAHPATRPPINVTFSDGPNAAGVDQRACTGCGNCITGCNDSAKNTVLFNYLPDAYAHGAEIFTELEVWTVARAPDGDWLVSFQSRGQGREVFGAPTQFVRAEVVVLAAGTLGSTAILLRSARAGLTVSPRVGERFSGNGDVVGFAFDADAEMGGLGGRDHTRLTSAKPGPCITGLVDLRDTPDVDDGLVIEDAVIPNALAGVLAAGLTLADAAGGASGALWGMLLAAVGGSLAGHEPPNAADVARALRAGLEAVEKIGRTAPGDKTLIDALDPFVDALERHAGTEELAAAWSRSLPAARAGRDATTAMVTRRGRAAALGEKSRGHVDPGAYSLCLVLEAVSATLTGGPQEA